VKVEGIWREMRSVADSHTIVRRVVRENFERRMLTTIRRIPGITARPALVKKAQEGDLLINEKEIRRWIEREVLTSASTRWSDS